MAVSSGGNERSLEQTPTWAVAVVCSFFVIISLLIEQAIHHAGTWLSRRHKKALYNALEKLKTELMLMGFISFLLTVGQKPISKICIPKGIAYTMLPCQKEESDPGTDHCSKQGKFPIVSPKGMNQLHYFIFTLASVHVLYSVLTIALATEKMRRWKAWEKEIATLDYQFLHDPERFRLTQQTSFVRRHMNLWSRTPILKWVVCFFRQFFRSIRKVDYRTLRHGFIVAHFSGHDKFDFHKYIKRSLDDDFSKVIGISVPLWAFAMVFMLMNLHNWHSYFWFSFVPLAIVLIVGMKLQLIILEMALEIQGRHVVVKGTPVVLLSDKLFWFGRPQFLLFLIHFTLFQNAFMLAFFLWTWWQFGLRSCFHEKFYRIIIRIVIGVVVQFICSYVTLPLYALVTQMGSHMKKTIFEERIASGLRNWHRRAKKDRKNRNPERGFSISRGANRSVETTPSRGSSPLHLMRRYNTVSDIENPDISPRYYHSEYEATESPEYSEAAKQHPISKQPEASTVSDIENPDISPRYYHSEYEATESPEYSKQHPISKQPEASNLEMVSSFAYPPKPTITASISETWGIEEVTEEHSSSKDVNTNSRDFSFVRF